MNSGKVIKAWWLAATARLGHARGHTGAALGGDHEPLRAVLFNADQMEQYGKALAADHVLDGVGSPDRLLKRLDANEQALMQICGLLTRAVKSRERIVPAAEWLLDNYHLIEEQIRTARQHLPKGYSRELHRLAQGPSRGLPRVYDLVLETISHGDGRVDVETLQRFVAAYQQVSPLALGELWAIPIMLRLALIENLARVGAQIGLARRHLNQAQIWAGRMLETAETDPKSLILVIADMARSGQPMTGPFVAELARRLQGHGPALALPLSWIEQHLAESSQTIEKMVLAENKQQASDQISISNSIGGLRALGALDWRDFVEALSAVERVLGDDPAGAYRLMDFATRDRYRHAVARLARRSGHAETVVARAAIELAQRAAASSPGHARAAHVGYYLIDQGLATLEIAVCGRRSFAAWARGRLRASRLAVFVGSIAVIGLLATAGMVRLASQDALPPLQLGLIAMLALLAGSQLGAALVNWLATLLVMPRPLPRLDYSQGIAADMNTLVVVPCMLTAREAIDDLLEALEVRFLGNRDRHLHFGLLTDYADAATQTTAGDPALLQQAEAGIAALNRKYPDAGDGSFFLFHRPRCWNTADQVWMGRERKRGKLADLNHALICGRWEAFATVVGEVAVLRELRYVITLDSDTQLPRDAARQFVAAMAHPLNRPQFDPLQRRVVAGYGILQPRMVASLIGAGRSRYAQLCGSEPGIDPYTRVVSDVYQDVFGEGSFIGKGIYDLHAFEQALRDQLPDNRILSHDLLEGCYARSGLLSDVHLYEDYPARYRNDADRQERWIRGDWQIASWLWPRVPAATGPAQRNPLPALARWKIADNLRRSLLPLALLALLVLGWWTIARAGLWTIAVLAVPMAPPLLALLVGFIRRIGRDPLAQQLSSTASSAAQGLALAVFRIACLPYEAASNLTAILRSLWRVNVSRRNLLAWRIAASTLSATAEGAPGRVPAGGAADGLLANYRRMLVAPGIALAVAALLLGQRPASLLAAAPLLLLWLLAPALAWALSRPLPRRQARLDASQTRFLRRSARKTWAFFERFVSAEDRWLPPDNFQQDPGPVLAHRTSPTNIGLALLANLAATDFGYLGVAGLLDRTHNCFATLAQLARHHGHFYNWYDTQSLQPLAPRYVSAVDSGNLAGHLLTLRAALLALPTQPLVGIRSFAGLQDTLELWAETAAVAEQPSIASLRTTLRAALSQPRAPLRAYALRLQALLRLAGGAPVSGVAGDAPDWRHNFFAQCQAANDELLQLAPWLQADATGGDLDGLVDSFPALRRYADAVDGGDMPTLGELATLAERLLPAIDARIQRINAPLQRGWLLRLRDQVVQASAAAAGLIEHANRLAAQASDFSTMQYEFLYDRARHLLAIGYNVDDLRRDSSYYDLLASEARLASFVVIAQGCLPQECWFALGRLLTAANGPPVLLSWSGSMFEYLMPQLVMPSYPGTLLDQTCRAAVARQIAYGKQRGVPWGVSESGYNIVDASLSYQYHAFGVPGLGLKRGLADDLVVAPYASALALMVDPQAACSNLQRLAADGLDGEYGFYEAIDYTGARLLRGQSAVIVRSFMAHHQGMLLLSLDHVLLDRPMQARFESDPQIQATLLLLQERVPKTAVPRRRLGASAEANAQVDVTEPTLQAPLPSDTPTPEINLLSNGRYQVMISNAGGGYSRWQQLALTRWREDSTCDNWGSFVYLRDVASGEYWSAAHQPTLKRADSYEAVFSEGRAEFRRRDHGIETYCEIVVSPEDDIELRRIRISNHDSVRRSIELTSYAEVVLAAAAADATQPAFGKLFVQTEIASERKAILCTRRPRSRDEATPWMFHMLSSNGSAVSRLSFETDRLRFIGRGNNLAAPAAMTSERPLSGSAGSVLDPIVAIRCLVTLEPEQAVTLDLITGAADTRESCSALVDKYQDRHFADRVLDVACTHAGVTLRQINASEYDAQLYRRLAGPVVYAQAALRGNAGVLAQNRRGQSGLWGYAISGDLPIVLLKIADAAHIELARQLIQCHAYWRLKGLAVDLVIWNEDHAGYRQNLQDLILGLIATGSEAHAIDRPGGIFVRRGEQIPAEDRILLQAVARVVIAGERGSLPEQIARRALSSKRMPRLRPPRAYRSEPPLAHAAPGADLILSNPLGGFRADGSEYVITTTHGQLTPAPWSNVLANPLFGSVISESGLAYSWSENAHEFRLSPWSDDNAGASAGEAIYLRDEETGHVWSPTPWPARGAMPYVTRHGFGYSVFEHSSGGIHTELWIYVDLDAAVKFSLLKIRNACGRSRRLSVTGYVEWVLGELRPKSAMHVVTEMHAIGGPLFARNDYNTEFSGRVGFFDVEAVERSVTGDRSEFIGRNGNLALPDALTRTRLSGRLGAGLDPCAAIMVPIELADGEEREIIFRLGAGADLEQAAEMARRLRAAGSANAALARVRHYWKRTLGAVQIDTPDPALNVLANGWLVYQTLACRVWARSGYQQSGGAFGFRDQLQDCMALVHSEPQLLREHLLRCAGQQFVEGDVLHWWHPPGGRGVRTRCSDDYLWLAVATCRYVQATGDVAVLDEPVAFLQGRLLADGEESYYDLPRRSGEQASLYQHCVRAIEHGLRLGPHGLPLMGSGDWNDGMNLVGIEGKGESVWLGFFLYQLLRSFADLAHRHDDLVFAGRCRKNAAKLRIDLERHGWDGAWYRRAYFDDGSPLGSAQNSDCSIDSIAQSWSVLSGAGDEQRCRTAMNALDQRLVDRRQQLVQLLDPPFDSAAMDPGYIKGYVPGVRENGGQYTHAAIWAAMAFAAQGDSARAWELMDLINPVNHGRSAQATMVYKAEPYVVAADVYAVAPHGGRAGWTWYTGSAGWMYRLIVESLLGITRCADSLQILPCLPEHWSRYSLRYRYGDTDYHIVVRQSLSVDGSSGRSMSVDGLDQGAGNLLLRDDRQPHLVEINLLRVPAPTPVAAVVLASGQG